MDHLRWIGAGALTVALLVAAPLAASLGAIPSGNLVQNPGAEDSLGSDVPTVVKPVGWETTGKFSTWAYPAAEGDWPTRAFAATIGGGKNFFAGGPGDNSGKQTTHTASQTIDISGAATEVDAGQVGAKLTAFIGGYTAAEDLATVTARFLSAAGAQLGSVRVGPVTRADRQVKTVLLKRDAQANVPPNTRSIGVVITVTADGNGANHAFVDNISLTLGKASTTSATTKATLTTRCSGTTLVATVKSAVGQKVKRVTFSMSGQKVVDSKAPFAARFATKGLPVQIVVKAQVASDRATQNLSKGVRRC